MWGKVVEQVRRAGPRKVAIVVIAAAIAVALAYGDNSSNDAAAGATLPKAAIGHVTTAATPAASRATR